MVKRNKSDSIKIRRNGRIVEVKVEYRNIPKRDRPAYKKRMQDRLSEVHKFELVFK